MFIFAPISNLARLKGDFASSMYPDALSTRQDLESLEEREWRNVELTDEDGEVATYLQLVSDNKASTSHFKKVAFDL